MAIPIVHIKWDEAVNPPPNYQVMRYRKYLPTENHTFPLIPSGQPNYTFVDDSIVEPGYYNKLWVYRVTSMCADGNTTNFAFAEFIKFTCDLTFESTPITSTTIPYKFYHMGGDIDSYDVKLFDEFGVQVGATITHNPSFEPFISGLFEELTPDTNYTLVVYPILSGTAYEGECINELTTLPVDNTYSFTHTNNTPVETVVLAIGNNNSSPSTILYNDTYTSGVVSGTDANLPCVNANVVLSVTTADTVVSMHCNGIPASAITGTGTYNGTWSDVNGAITLSFLTT